MTKEEKFLVRLYEMAKLYGDEFAPMNAEKVGQSIALHTRGIKNICNILAQTNFIKKAEDGEVQLTPHGLKLVMELKNKKL